MKAVLTKGFSLLELLVVIALIGILVSIGAASYTSGQRKTRDSRRTADMKAVQNALEQYYAANSAVYPTQSSSLVPSYLPGGVPDDPKPGLDYIWTLTAASYCVCSTLEGTTTGGNATNTSCTYGSGAYFCVSSLQ